MANPINNTESAFITGDTPSLIIEYILRGSVDEPGPATKKVATKSSNDNVRAIKNPEIIAGISIGIITFLKPASQLHLNHMQLPLLNNLFQQVLKAL